MLKHIYCGLNSVPRCGSVICNNACLLWLQVRGHWRAALSDYQVFFLVFFLFSPPFFCLSALLSSHLRSCTAGQCYYYVLLMPLYHATHPISQVLIITTCVKPCTACLNPCCVNHTVASSIPFDVPFPSRGHRSFWLIQPASMSARPKYIINELLKEDWWDQRLGDAEGGDRSLSSMLLNIVPA
jgi:hypothetical protein